MSRINPELLERALDGDRSAQEELVLLLTPVIHARVGEVLRRHARPGRRNFRQEIEDFTQEVWVILFKDKARNLRRWSPEGGLSLESWVGKRATWKAREILRLQSKGPWPDDPTVDMELAEHPHPAPDVDLRTISADMARRVIERARGEMSERRFQMFWWLVIEQLSVEEVSALTSLAPAAIHNWHKQVRDHVRRIAFEIMGDPDGGPYNP